MLQTVAMMLSLACADQCNDAMFVVLPTSAMLRSFVNTISMMISFVFVAEHWPCC